MFDRLKSLPLTIVLTILIWMYAESQVNSTQGESRTTLFDIPVWISGPPDMLARYDVTLQPPTVNITVSGTPDQIEMLRHLPRGHITGVQAYLDITPDDRPGTQWNFRLLRFVLPVGVTILQSPQVAFTMTETPNSPPPKAPPASVPAR